MCQNYNTLSTVIPLFLKYLEVEKKYSKHTVLSYQNDLESLAEYSLSQYEVNDVSELKHLHIRSWIVRLMSEGISPVSVNRKISACRSFYKWLIKRGDIQVNPMIKITAPKKPKRLPTSIHDKSINKMAEVPLMTDTDNDFEISRDHLIMTMLYSTGMRRAELVSLNMKDVDLARNELRVTGKGNKVRSIPVISSLKTDILNYLCVRESLENVTDTEALFLTAKGKRIYPKMVYNIVHRELSLITTLDKKSPHVLRHTFATHMLDNGADIHAIKEILGHSHLGATQIYTHNSISKLKEAYKKAHPHA